MVVYTVMCTILGDKNAFSVKIDSNESVSELKNRIKPVDLIEASALQLFKINAYGTTNKERTKALEKELQRINHDALLNKFNIIKEVFPEMPPAKTYHILVVPPQGEHSTNGHGHW